MSDKCELPGIMYFSFVTGFQIQSLKVVHEEIRSLCGENIKDGSVENMVRITALIWLWILGAWEVLRTMKQHEKCFPFDIHEEIKILKEQIWDVRTQMTKQERRRKGKKNEFCVDFNSVADINFEKQDFGYGYNKKDIELFYQSDFAIRFFELMSKIDSLSSSKISSIVKSFDDSKKTS